MTEYVSRVLLEVDGQSVEDFKSVTDKEVEYHKEVKLMNKTGFMSAMPRFFVDVEYVVPESEAEFDWAGVADGTLSVEKMNGKRVTYSGVYVLKVGDVKYDPDNEATRTISLGATERNEE